VIKEIASGNIDVGQAAVSHSWSELEKGHKPSEAQFAQINTCIGFENQTMVKSLKFFKKR